jgi:hypothetical protein
MTSWRGRLAWSVACALGVELARLEAGDVDISLGSVRHAAEGALEAGERL